MFWSKDKALESTRKGHIPTPPPNLNADNLDINNITTITSLVEQAMYNHAKKERLESIINKKVRELGLGIDMRLSEEEEPTTKMNFKELVKHKNEALADIIVSKLSSVILEKKFRYFREDQRIFFNIGTLPIDSIANKPEEWITYESKQITAQAITTTDTYKSFIAHLKDTTDLKDFELIMDDNGIRLNCWFDQTKPLDK
jgi:hypothetical protein